MDERSVELRAGGRGRHARAEGYGNAEELGGFGRGASCTFLRKTTSPSPAADQRLRPRKSRLSDSSHTVATSHAYSAALKDKSHGMAAWRLKSGAQRALNSTGYSSRVVQVQRFCLAPAYCSQRERSDRDQPRRLATTTAPGEGPAASLRWKPRRAPRGQCSRPLVGGEAYAAKIGR